MGLYDDMDTGSSYEPESNTEEIGKAILKSSKKKKSNKLNFNLGIPPIATKIALYVLGLFLAVVVVYAMYLVIQPSMISYELNPNPVYLGTNTAGKLRISVENIEEFTLNNIEVNAHATDDLSVVVMPSEPKLIPILGVGEDRVLEYDVELISGATEGSYAIDISVRTPAKVYKENVIWEVKSVQ